MMRTMVFLGMVVLAFLLITSPVIAGTNIYEWRATTDLGYFDWTIYAVTSSPSSQFVYTHVDGYGVSGINYDISWDITNNWWPWFNSDDWDPNSDYVADYFRSDTMTYDGFAFNQVDTRGNTYRHWGEACTWYWPLGIDLSCDDYAPRITIPSS